MHWLGVGLLTVMLGTSSNAFAQTDVQKTPPAPATAADLDKSATATAADLDKSATSQSLSNPSTPFYPPDAQRNAKEGTATVQCLILDGGGLDRCKLLSEDPPGRSFGDAALKIVAKLKLKPHADGGPLAGGTFKTKLTFKLAP